MRADFPGGWPGDDSDAVSGRGLAPLSAATQAWLKTVLNWRKHTPLLHGDQLMQYAPQDGTYVYFRHDPAQDGRVMVAFNKNAHAVDLPLGRFAEMIGPGLQAFDPVSGQRFALGDTLALPPRSVRLLALTR